MENNEIQISPFIKIVDGRVFCPAGDAARIIPPIIRFKTKEGEQKDFLVFVEEFRAPLDKKIYNFPGGRLNKGEDALKAIVRELLEETGLQIDNLKDIKQVMNSKLKDPTNSKEGECLFVCPQIIQVNENQSAYIDSLYKNQNLDEFENCKIKLVDVSKIQDFLQTTDMCLPTRLSLLWYLKTKNIKCEANQKFNIDHKSEGTVKSLSEKYRAEKFTINGANVGYEHCYYTCECDRLVSALLKVNVGGKSFYAFQGKDGLLSMPSFGFNHEKEDNNKDSSHWVKQVLSSNKFPEDIINCEFVTPFDAVSPGITDLRQCICRAEVNIERDRFEQLKHDGFVFVEPKDLQKVANSEKSDYITALGTMVEATTLTKQVNKTDETIR